MEGAAAAPLQEQEQGKVQEQVEKALRSEREDGMQIVTVEIEAPVNKFKIEYQLPMVVQLAEVRLYLQESDMWYVTRFLFTHNGNKVADYVDLGSLLSDEARSVPEPRLSLRLVPVPYDLQSALFHLRTLRSRLFPLPNSASMSLFCSIAGTRTPAVGNAGKSTAGKKKRKKNNGNNNNNAAKKEEGESVKTEVVPHTHVETDFVMEAPSLAEYFPRPVDPCPAAVKAISFAAWNPVPSQRRLQGDMFYVEITTLENKSVFVTAAERGWFVNASSKTKFDPSPAAAPSEVFSLLPDLLAAVSPTFRGNFSSLNKRNSRVDSIETLQFGGAPPPWVGLPDQEHATPKPSYAEEAFLRLHGYCHPAGMARDWNEEYQILYAHVNVASENRFATLNNLFRVHSEFVAACQRGAVAVVDGEVAPLNPHDPPAAQMWMHDNIFFSKAVNVNGMFDGLGGDVAAHKNASHEIMGIRLLRNAGVAGLNACAQCVVDYRGRRVVCQSVVPGVLTVGDVQLQQMQQSEEGRVETAGGHAFGPTDDMQRYLENPAFEALTAELAKRLGLRSSAVKYADKTVKVHGPVEVRGLMGGDKRKYVFEVLRLLPRDCNMPEKEKSYCLYRPELMGMFRDHMASLSVQDYAEKKKARDEERAKAAAAAAAAAAAEGGDKKLEEAPPAAAAADEDVIYLPDMSVNVNLLVHDERLVPESEEEARRERSLLDNIGKFLKELAIPSFVQVCTQVPLPADLTVLVTMLHERGINARYLGAVATRAAPVLPQLAFLCIEEMVVRAAKALLRAELAAATVGESAAVAARFLNRFLGSRYQKSSAKPGFSGDQQFWETIKSEVQARFGFALPLDAKMGQRLRKVTLLRSLCLAVGMTVEARVYNWESTEPFLADHILAFHPLARHFPPELPDISDMMSKARELISRPGSVPEGIDMLEHAMQAVYHIMGPHTVQAANAHQLLANAYFQLGDAGLSVQHTERAVLILERLKGLDHESTVRAYSNLATFYLECGLHSLALPFVRRSLYLERLVNGVEDQAVPQSMTNLAAVLKEMGDFEGATRAMQMVLQMYERSGNEVMATHTCRELALCYQSAGAFKDALAYEKRYNKVLARFYAPEHEKVKESNELLSALTGLAVQDARERVKAAKAAPLASAASGAVPSRQQKAPRGPMSVLPKPGSNMQPLSRVLSMINKQKK